MSVLDPLNYTSTLLSQIEPETLDDLPVIPAHLLGRRHSIAVHNDLEQFAQSYNSSRSYDREKSFEMESSVCDISRKRRTSICCNVEPGTRYDVPSGEPPRKRRLSVCADSLQEQLINDIEEGIVSSSSPYHIENLPDNEERETAQQRMARFRRGSVPNVAAMNGYHFASNSPYNGSFYSNPESRNNGQGYRTHSSLRKQTSPPPLCSSYSPEQTQTPHRDYFQQTPNETQYYESSEYNEQPTPSYYNSQTQEFSEQNSLYPSQAPNEMAQTYESPREYLPSNFQNNFSQNENSGLFTPQSFSEMKPDPSRSPFEDTAVFSTPSSTFSQENFNTPQLSVNDFPLANANFNQIPQNPIEDLNLNVDIHENRQQREREEKKKGLKWTNVTASVTMKYAKEPRSRKETPTPQGNAITAQSDTKEAAKKLVGRWKCMKYTV